MSGYVDYVNPIVRFCEGLLTVNLELVGWYNKDMTLYILSSIWSFPFIHAKLYGLAPTS